MRLSNILLLFIVLLATACRTSTNTFDEDDARTRAFYAHILPDVCSRKPVSADSSTINHLTVYRTSFEDKLIESGNIITVSSINENSVRPTVDYKTALGHSQQLYLVHVQSSDECVGDAWYYFSVWFRPDYERPEKVQYGYGRAYLGIGNDSNSTIHFNYQLYFKKTSEGFRLAKKSTADFLFVIDKSDEHAKRISIKKIVVEENNKFGGPRAYVFNVGTHFTEDFHTLDFTKVYSNSFQ